MWLISCFKACNNRFLNLTLSRCLYSSVDVTSSVKWSALHLTLGQGYQLKIHVHRAHLLMLAGLDHVSDPKNDILKPIYEMSQKCSISHCSYSLSSKKDPLFY